jgi:hypothetical protein
VRTRLLLLAFLAVLALTETHSRFVNSPGVDFYHYWAVGKASRFSAEPLGSPYANRDAYAAALNARADSGQEDARFEAANRRRRQLDPTGTPLFYACFLFLPSDYSFAFALHQSLQVLFLVASVFLLGRVHRVSPYETLALGLLLVVVYWPMLSDLRVGNVGSFQLAALVALTASAVRDARSGVGERRGGGFLAALTFLTMLKPTIGFVTFLLALQLWLRRPASRRLPAFYPSLAVAAAGFMLPCIAFGSWSVWTDWIVLLRERGGFPIQQGNHSTPLLLSEAFGIDVDVAGSGVLLLLLCSAAIALWRAPRGATRFLADPMRVAAIGIVATLALSRLAWAHYFVLSLLPALWLFWSPRRGGAWLAVASLAMTSTILGAVVELSGWSPILRYSLAASWVPLWFGILTAPLPGKGGST